MKYNDDEYNIDDVIPEKDKPKSKKRDLLSEIRDMESDEYVSPKGFDSSSFLPSSLLTRTSLSDILTDKPYISLITSNSKLVDDDGTKP